MNNGEIAATEKEFFENSLKIHDKGLLEDVLKAAETHPIPKGAFLIRQGQYPTRIAFLLWGTFRGYYVDENGETRPSDGNDVGAGDGAMIMIPAPDDAAGGGTEGSTEDAPAEQLPIEFTGEVREFTIPAGAKITNAIDSHPRSPNASFCHVPPMYSITKYSLCSSI